MQKYKISLICNVADEKKAITIKRGLQQVLNKVDIADLTKLLTAIGNNPKSISKALPYLKFLK